MKTNIKDESLKDAAKEYADADLHINYDYWSKRKLDFKQGASLQASKDKETINALLVAFKSVLAALNDADFWANRQDWEKIESAKKLVASIEKQNTL